MFQKRFLAAGAGHWLPVIFCCLLLLGSNGFAAEQGKGWVAGPSANEADLRLSASGGSVDVGPGEDFFFEFQLENLGPDDAGNVSLVFTLHEKISLNISPVNPLPFGCASSHATPEQLTCTYPNFGWGEGNKRTYFLSARLDSSALPCTALKSVATVQSDTHDPNDGDNSIEFETIVTGDCGDVIFADGFGS